MDTFTETQRFRQWWVWVLMGFIALVVLIGLYRTNAWRDPESIVSMLIPGIIMLLLFVWRQDTRLDQEGIHYRVFPLVPWRTIQWPAIRSASVQKYGFVGYGIRWGFEGWVYNVSGDKGLRIIFSDKRQITLGTQRPEEIETFLTNHSALITT